MPRTMESGRSAEGVEKERGKRRERAEGEKVAGG